MRVYLTKFTPSSISLLRVSFFSLYFSSFVSIPRQSCSSPFPQNTYNSFSRTPSSQTRSTANHSRQMHYEPVPFSRGTLFEDARSISTVSSAPGIVVVNEEGEQVYECVFTPQVLLINEWQRVSEIFLNFYYILNTILLNA